MEELLTKRSEDIRLGLSVVKKIVEALKGNISVKSTLHQGSEFVIDLPAVFIEEEYEKIYSI